MIPGYIQLDPRYQVRRDRALNMTLGAGSKYHATADHCDCPDAQYRAPQGWCKHRITAQMEEDWQKDDARRRAAADPTLGGLYPA
jgi:hypothetical protein